MKSSQTRYLETKLCAACGGSALAGCLELPAFPLTGIFVPEAEGAKYPVFDQALMRCEACGHAQLLNAVDPEFLYQETYTHRSSASPLSTRGNDFFYGYLNEVAGADARFRSVAEIGCNDLYLLRKLEERSDELIGFDPIWKDRPAPESAKIDVRGRYIEEIDPEADLPVRPDLVLSVHTLEHVRDPLTSLRPIYERAADGALFVFEVPGFDSLLRVCRFDQVFHQHLNYYSVASMRRMIKALGGEYISHRFNYGYWQGTMLMAFRKRGGRPDGTTVSAASAPEREHILERFELFSAQLRASRGVLDGFRREKTPIYGFGAAQMLPTVAYHWKSDLSEFEAIFDDNIDKKGLFYPGFRAPIQSPPDAGLLREGAAVITAIDSARPLFQKLTALQARYIVLPLQTL